jgi:hypothetical protein
MLDTAGIPIIKKREKAKEVNFTVMGDPSGGVRLRWNQDEIVLSPDDGVRIIQAIAKALHMEVSLPEAN